MDLIRFLNQVDTLSETMEADDLRRLVHRIARKTPIDTRDIFLQYFTSETLPPDKLTVATVIDELQKIQDEDLSIRLKEIDLVRWYDEAEEEEEYEDEHHICATVEHLCAIVNKCVDERQYAVAAEMFRFLENYRVTAVRENGEKVSFSLDDLMLENLVNVDIDALRINFLYALYMSTPAEERAKALYDYMSKWERSRFRLENILQAGSQEPDHLEQFLTDWIDLLKRKPGIYELDLLLEALRFENKGRLPEIAEENSDVHPALYQEWMADEDDITVLMIAEDAIAHIPANLMIRADIALQGAEAALRLQNKKQAEMFYLEAFASDTSFVNYIRLIHESEDPEEYRERIEEIIRNAEQRENITGTYGELLENQPSDSALKTMRFMQGDLNLARQYVLSHAQVFGWSRTYMKAAVPMLMLYLYNGSLKSPACDAMISMVLNEVGFLSADYQKGTLDEEEKDSEELFRECLIDWKKTHPLARSDRDRLLADVGRIIEKRTNSILSHSIRSKYSECASLIAMQGEIEESLGDRNGRRAMLEIYRRKYYRDQNFHNALAVYM